MDHLMVKKYQKYYLNYILVRLTLNNLGLLLMFFHFHFLVLYIHLGHFLNIENFVWLLDVLIFVVFDFYGFYHLISYLILKKKKKKKMIKIKIIV